MVPAATPPDEDCGFYSKKNCPVPWVRCWFWRESIPLAGSSGDTGSVMSWLILFWVCPRMTPVPTVCFVGLPVGVIWALNWLNSLPYSLACNCVSPLCKRSVTLLDRSPWALPTWKVTGPADTLFFSPKLDFCTLFNLYWWAEVKIRISEYIRIESKEIMNELTL